jgi:hypothetical protein
MTEQEWTVALESMAKAGAERGKAAASWLFDGNTDGATYREWLRMFDEGDPALDGPGSPFSGEWADGLVLREVIEDETDVDYEASEPEEIDELATAFEDAYSQAWWDEAERVARYHVED